MRREIPDTILMCLCCVSAGAIATLFFSFEKFYRAGQIDALTGKIKYHLAEKENGERAWERIEDE